MKAHVITFTLATALLVAPAIAGAPLKGVGGKTATAQAKKTPGKPAAKPAAAKTATKAAAKPQ